MSSFWSKNPQMQAKIKDICDLIEKRVVIRNPEIETAIVELSVSGGKYLRPAFFYLFAGFGDSKKAETTDLTKIASSLEILHMATLMHDDIIDDSPLRRGQATVQSKFGKDVAVYTGDLLFTVFFELILETMVDTPYLAINAKAMKKILMGELNQMHLQFNQVQSVRDYLHSVSGKTAELFRLAAKEGAYFGGATSDIVRLAGRIGHNIGMAFQILDDILDYTADPKTFNKPVLEDLPNGVYSLPLLFALEQKPEAFKELLDKKEKISLEDRKSVAKLVKEIGGVEASRQLARRFTQKAILDIQQLPEAKAKNDLLKLTNHLLKRQI
ncbi:polyprenyl synthetase family protein [Streptococcus ictaluri]|uniref:Polyprenyl synthetase n=1 Tax=Streptococcus ictaluri 707-05 TaxID=764299 RepID=G5K4J6_9STRE|nr:polyprenyl synthetase family protein [Streptococcus ictaluri]EHI69015.1 polyprenyl synthetase [Streptococcus ictaluri 707-05]